MEIEAKTLPPNPPTFSHQVSEKSFVMQEIKEVEQENALANEKIDSIIQNKILADESSEAKAGRLHMMIRAILGEFMCSLLYFGPAFFCLVNAHRNNWGPALTQIAYAFATGLNGIGLCFAFSSISGAQFNPAISFGLWITGKLGHYRFLSYIIVQMLASIIATACIPCMFSGTLKSSYDALAVIPIDKNQIGRVFGTEFILTFLFVYVIFTVVYEDAEKQKKENMSFKTISDSKGLTLYATNPQSKTGFAPFTIGFILFTLNLACGNSGGAFNPARIFGPAIFSGHWDYIYVYWLAELSAAATASLLVHYFTPSTKHETSEGVLKIFEKRNSKVF